MKLQRLPRVTFERVLAPHGWCYNMVLKLDEVQTWVQLTPEGYMDWRYGGYIIPSEMKKAYDYALLEYGIDDPVERSYICRELEKYVFSPGVKFI
jgi:hypothetical protein